MPIVDAEQLAGAVARVLGAGGTPDDIAAKMGRWLVRADLSGHASHGVIRVADYLRFAREGRVDPAARPARRDGHGAGVLIDGNLGYGHLGAEALTLELVQAARQAGLAVGGLVRVAHIGRLGEWAELATDQGVFFFICAGWRQGRNAAPFGGAQAKLATNPFAFGAPATSGDRMVLDIATTVVAEGKVRHYRDAGLAIPSGWVLDAEGRPTTDPNDLYAGGTLLPFGGHKGYGVAVMVATLGASLVGTGGGSPEAGVFALAIDPGLFGDAEATGRAVGELLGDLRSTTPAAGSAGVLVPGDVEEAARRAAGGRVDIPAGTWQQLEAAAAEVGADEAITELAGATDGPAGAGGGDG